MAEKHEFDPGWTGLSTQCNRLVVKPGTTYADTCGMPRGNAIHFQPDEQCVGCLTGHDIGLPSSAVAYPHPECPVHGDTESEPLSPEQEEMLPPDTAVVECWCGGEVGKRTPGDGDGLGCLENIHHYWRGESEDDFWLD